MEVQNRIVEQTNIQLGRQLVQQEFRTNSPGVIFEVEGMISQFWLHRVLPHELLNWPVELLKLKRVSVIPHRLDDWIKHKGHWPKELPQLFMPIANACWQRFSHLRNIQRWQVSWKLHHSGWVTDAGVSNCQSADHVLSSHNHGAIIRPLSSCVVDLTQDCVPRIPMYQALLATENNDTNELNNDIDWHWPMTLVDIHDWQWLTDWLSWDWKPAVGSMHILEMAWLTEQIKFEDTSLSCEFRWHYMAVGVHCALWLTDSGWLLMIHWHESAQKVATI